MDNLGGRFQSAGVGLFIQPADKFMFLSKVKWEYENFEDAILKGINDGFEDIGIEIEKGISVHLTDVICHQIDSSWKSFYIASRIAIRTRLDLRELHSSIPNKWELNKPDTDSL
jgi:hypothetical protein